MSTHIPCEYCDELISIHDWEWHSVCNNDILLLQISIFVDYIVETMC